MSNNPWINYVKKIAKSNNITYPCALAIAKSTYQNDKAKMLKEMNEKNEKQQIKTYKSLLDKIKPAIDDHIKNGTSIEFIKQNFKNRSKQVKDLFKKNEPEIYTILTEDQKPILTSKQRAEKDKKIKEELKEAEIEQKKIEKEFNERRKEQERKDDEERALNLKNRQAVGEIKAIIDEIKKDQIKLNKSRTELTANKYVNKIEDLFKELDKKTKDMKGGSITPPLLQKILEETYYEDKPSPNIDGYQLDEQLSKLSKISGLMTCLVYVKDKQVYVGIRGTNTETYKGVSAGDWLNNAVLGVSLIAYKQTDRYKKARSTLVQVIKKYKGYNIDILGHSQSGMIVHLLMTEFKGKIKNAIGVNPAFKDTKINNDEYVIRSTADVVSALAVPSKMLNNILYPSFSKKHLIEIKAKTSNPLTEHKPSILERLDPEMKIGKGKKPILKGYIINEMMGGCACKLNHASKIDVMLKKRE